MASSWKTRRKMPGTGADWTDTQRGRGGARAVDIVVISFLVLAWQCWRSLSGLGTFPKHRGWIAWLPLMDEVTTGHLRDY